MGNRFREIQEMTRVEVLKKVCTAGGRVAAALFVCTPGSRATLAWCESRTSQGSVLRIQSCGQGQPLRSRCVAFIDHYIATWNRLCPTKCQRLTQ